MADQLRSTRIPTLRGVATYIVRELIATLSLVAIAIFDVGSAAPDPVVRIPLILLHLLFFLSFVGIDLINLRRPVSGHVALAVLVLIQLLLIWNGSNPTTQIVLLFVLSAYAHEALPEFLANLWIFGFGIATMIGFSFLIQDPLFGALIGLGALGGFVFIGYAARNRRVAEAARAESQRLLQELQTAHEQLKRHAHETEIFAAAEERNRVARELHDTLGHRLTVAAVQLEGAQRLISRDTKRAEEMVSTVRGQVLDALTELRQTVAALRTPIEADLALPAAIARLANQFATATGLQVHVQINDQLQPDLDQLSRNARHTLYRAAQEALTNIQKHANATTTWIQLERTEGAGPTVQLVIHDDGVGYNIHGESGEERRGFGLAGLAERAAQNNGTLQIEGSPFGGCALYITFPLEQPTNLPATAPTFTDPL